MLLYLALITRSIRCPLATTQSAVPAALSPFQEIGYSGKIVGDVVLWQPTLDTSNLHAAVVKSRESGLDVTHVAVRLRWRGHLVIRLLSCRRVREVHE
jgi:hypothetical protein